MKSSRRSGTEARMKATLTLTPVLLLALVMARPFAVQPAPRLALELQDYAALPITADNTDDEHARAAGPRQLPARRAGRPPLLRQRSQRSALHPRQADEDVHDLSRLQRRRRAAGPVPEVHLRAQLRHRPHQLPLRSRLRAQRRVLHAPHGGPGHCRAAPRREAGVVAGLDLSGYTTTPAIPTPTVDGQIEREVVLIEWKDRNPANATFEGTARELLRVQHPLPHPSAGRDDVQSGRATAAIRTGASCTSGPATRSPASSATAAA